MSVLVGIDEAGYGPILGPLTIFCSAFRMPREKLAADMWQILGRSVSRSKKRLAGRLIICDSKKAFDRSVGVSSLQRTILCALGCIGGSSMPANIRQAVEMLCPDSAHQLNEYPWYHKLDACPIITDQADIGIARHTLLNDLQNNSMEILAMRGYCLDAGHYNELVEKVRNKASVLFTHVCRHIQAAIDNWGREDLQIVIDRQGGRDNYAPLLRRMFGQMELEIIRQDSRMSSYQLRYGEKTVRLHFVVKADENYLPVCLASMAGKYVRELLMDRINEYFLSRCPGLAPTAGYWQDGSRFIREIKDNHPTCQYDYNKLVRMK